MITTKHIGILLLVSESEFANDYTIIKIIDRIWFPSNISESMDVLVSLGYIEPFVLKQYNENYKLTTKAVELIRKTRLDDLLDNDGAFEEKNKLEKDILTKLYHKILSKK